MFCDVKVKKNIFMFSIISTGGTGARREEEGCTMCY